MNFEDLYRTYFPMVWRMLRRFGVSERDVQDKAQKVFLVAFQKLDGFEGRSSIKTWLCGITLRVAADYRKGAAHRREVFHEEPFEELDTRDPEQWLERRERLLELDAVLSALPLEQRTVFVLFEFEDLSGEQIAQVVGVSEGTVRSRLRLARQAFSRTFAERPLSQVRLAKVGES